MTTTTQGNWTDATDKVATIRYGRLTVDELRHRQAVANETYNRARDAGNIGALCDARRMLAVLRVELHRRGIY